MPGRRVAHLISVRAPDGRAVLIDGELVMSGGTGGLDVQTRRTSQRGAFFSTKPEGEGTGLGLDLAWRIVQNLSVQTTPGGTRFIVCLPLEAPAPEMAASDDPIAPA